MIRKVLCRLLVLSLVISYAIAIEDNVEVDEKPTIDESDKKEDEIAEKTVSKRGVFHFSTHGNAHPAIVSATQYQLPSSAGSIRIKLVPHTHSHAHVPHVHAPVPHFHSAVPHVHSVPAEVPHVHAAVPHVHSVAPHAHAAIPHFHSVPHAHVPAAIPVDHHVHAHAHFPHVHSIPAAAPHFHSVPAAAPHFHSVPAAAPHFHSVPHVHTPAFIPAQPAFIPAPVSPAFKVVPGGASVTSYSVNYPRFRQLVPAYAPPVLAAAPGLHHNHHAVGPAVATVPHYHTPAVPHYHTPAAPVYPSFVPQKPLIPVAVAVPGIRYPKYPVFANHPRPVFSGGFNPQLVPFATPQPTFVPIPVPSQPQPQLPTAGMSHDTNLNPATQEFPLLHAPTSPTFVQPTMPTVSSHGWRPITSMVMTQHHNHHPQSTRPTFTDKYPPYNYHAPAMPLYHEPPSSSNVISGHGQMSGQLAQQLALYQQQQYDNSFSYPEAAETFHQNYDQASNEGSYEGLSSYQVPIHKRND